MTGLDRSPTLALGGPQCEYIGVIPGSEDLWQCPFAAVWRISCMDLQFISCDPHAHDFLDDEPEAQAFPLDR